METDMTGFWKVWIQVWCWGTLVFGVVLLGAAHPTTEAPARMFYDLIYWPIDGGSRFDGEAFRLTVAVLGAVMIGWAVTIFGAIKAAHSGSPELWRAITTAMAVWYIVDSAASVMNGSPMNAVSNTVFLVAWLIPMLATGVLRRG
jgi:hypothetical protein